MTSLRRIVVSLFVQMLSVSALLIGEARAQAQVGYLSATGTDSGTCDTAASPCSSFFYVFSQIAVGGEIVCLTPVNIGGAYITKSVTLNCASFGATIKASGAPINTCAPGSQSAGVAIDIPVSAGDPFRTVKLRGLYIDSLVGSSQLIGRGITICSARTVYLENVVISDSPLQGIFDKRTGGQTKLFVTDSIIRNNSGVGILLGAQAPSTTVIDNVRSEGNLYGLAAASGSTVLIRNSVFSGNSNAGVEGDSGAQIVLDNSSASHNSVGVESNLSVRLSNNNIAFNTTAISGASGTFGNNRFSGNGSMGTAPTALGGATSDLGQQ